jgi:putative tryptophan/tyrosine transport system substrate-binding protein
LQLLGLLHEIVPNATTLGILVNPGNPNAEPSARDAQIAADALGRRLLVVKAAAERDFEPAFAAMIQSQVGAAYVNIDSLFMSRRGQIIASAAHHGIPVMYDGRDFPTEGGLMSYGASQSASWHLSAVYVGRILKGEKPADLPVQQATKFELVINLKTATALGLDIPPGVLATADDVIE